MGWRQFGIHLGAVRPGISRGNLLPHKAGTLPPSGPVTAGVSLRRACESIRVVCGVLGTFRIRRHFGARSIERKAAARSNGEAVRKPKANINDAVGAARAAAVSASPQRRAGAISTSEGRPASITFSSSGMACPGRGECWRRRLPILYRMPTASSDEVDDFGGIWRSVRANGSDKYCQALER